MKKYILALVLSLFTLSAFADVDTFGLTPTQKAELALQAAKMKEAANKQPVEIAKQVVNANDAAIDVSKKWAGVGKELASGIVATAKELGIAANEFAATPLGKIATTLIIWNYMGKSIVLLFTGLGLFFIGLPTIYYVYRRMIVIKVEWETVPWVFGITRRKVKSVERAEDEAFIIPTLLFLVATVAVVIVALNLISGVV